jgi:hypothetical protein
MKTLTITALLGVLVAIPLIFARRKATVVPVALRSEGRTANVNLLYDVDDLITS